ncbi:MAG: hypothetical protein ACKO3P_22660, partial [Planctomycetaceae bacterium]
VSRSGAGEGLPGGRDNGAATGELPGGVVAADRHGPAGALGSGALGSGVLPPGAVPPGGSWISTEPAG